MMYEIQEKNHPGLFGSLKKASPSYLTLARTKLFLLPHLLHICLIKVSGTQKWNRLGLFGLLTGACYSVGATCASYLIRVVVYVIWWSMKDSIFDHYEEQKVRESE